MADITVTGSANFSAVTNGLKRMSAESAKMQKQSGQASMRILELSRGIEDFAVAGMRGATNNIPGFVMSLGGGAGVAGAASLAAVAITLLSKEVDEFQEKMNARRETKLFGDAWFDPTSITTDFTKTLKEIDRQVEAGAAKMRDVMGMATEGDKIRGSNQRIADLKAQEESARKSLELLKAGKTEEEGRADAIADELLGLQQKEDAQKKSIEATRLGVKVLGEEIEQQKLVIDKYVEMKDAAREARGAMVKGALGKEVSQIGERTGKWSWIARPIEDITRERGMNLKGAMDDFRRGFDKEALQKQEIAAGIAAERIKNFREQESVGINILKAAELENKERTTAFNTTRALLELEKETLRVKEDQAAIAAMSSGEKFFPGLPSLSDIRAISDLIASMDEQWNQSASKMRIDGSGMLSSSGRIGGSGVEFQASVATINYQREAINNLKKIERNTRNRTSTYN